MRQSSLQFFIKSIPIFLLLFITPNLSYAQALCPSAIVVDADAGVCCAEVIFGSKSIISGTVVEDPVALIHGTQNTPIAIGYNPDLDLYYIGRGGFTSVQISTHDPSDGSLLHTEIGNFDYRGLWWNQNDDVLQGNGFYDAGYRTVDLDANGYALGSGTDVTGQHQPNRQTQCHYDYEANEVIGRELLQVYRYQLDGTALGNYSLTGAPTTNWNRYWVGYSGVPGSEIMVYDHVNRSVLFFDKATGIYSQQKALPANAPNPSYWNVGFANERIWIFDYNSDTWKGYQITEGSGGGGFSADYTYTQTAGLPSGSCFPIGTTTNTFDVTDDETGAMTTCTFEVIVSDAEAPSSTCPAAITLACDDSTSPNTTGFPTATDNCSAMADMTMTYSDVSSYVGGNEIITRSWIVSDEAGNPSSSCQQIITLEGITNANSMDAWIQTVDVANLNNDSGNDGGYVAFGMNTVLTIGGDHVATLTPGYANMDERAYWRIYVDLNQDGIFHHGSERVAQGNGIGEIEKNFDIPGSALEGNTKMRITMGLNGYVFPCDSDFSGEVEDYNVTMAECTPLTYAGEIGFDQAICPGDDNPYAIGDLFQATGPVNGFIEYIWMMNETNCIPTDGTESNGWSIIAGETDSYYDPPSLSTSTLFVRGERAYGCQDYIFSNMVEVVYTDDCIPDCASEGLSTADEYIWRVKFGNMINISGDDGGYADYTNMNADVTYGQKVPYQLRPKFYNGSRVVYWRVWADWNQDGHFSDLCELIVEASSNHTENGKYTIPESALSGQTKFRVAMKYGSYPESCESFASGEVEDYSVTVGVSPFMADGDIDLFQSESSSNDDAFATADFELYPNPSTGNINLDFTNLAEENTLVINNHLGQRVYSQENVSSEHLQLDLSEIGLSPGLYLINMQTKTKVISKKLFYVNR